MLAESESQFVCNDDDGDWYYYPEFQTYRRIKDGKVRSSVTGEHLPDPHFLLSRRRALYPQASEQEIRPTKATYALWEDWNARQ